MTVPDAIDQLFPEGGLRGTFGKPFGQQVAAFRLRLGDLVPTAKWDDIQRDAHDRAFMVAGATKADLLADLALAVDKAISEGTGLAEFRRDFRGIVERHGWHGWTGEGTKGGEAWRTKVIYRTNMRTTYMAGRYAQLVEGGFEYWVYRHGGSLHPREQHLAWDGLILRPGHDFWKKYFPPSDWGCSCNVFGARSWAGALRLGGNPALKLSEDWDAIDPETGAPFGIGRGWDYAPGASVVDTVRLAADKIQKLPAAVGSDYGVAMDALIQRYWPIWVADTMAAADQKRAPEYGLVGVISRPILDALAKRGIHPVHSSLTVNAGTLAGRKSRRHEAAGDQLSPEVWVWLAQAIQKPRAVLWDEDNFSLVYVLGTSEKPVRLAVRLNRREDRKTAGRKAKTVENVIRSAHHARLEGITGRVVGGKMTLLLGSLG